MIHKLALRRQKLIAWFFLIVFYISTVIPGYGLVSKDVKKSYCTKYSVGNIKTKKPVVSILSPIHEAAQKNKVIPFLNTADLADIGGPSQPEMSSFQSVNSNNLVNLFNGSFNYNIPLLDVGGYPVNIFYDANITPEQEASWVGLGWNINPGVITRNMRGVPDDFDGTDMMIQTQTIKPNNTFGVNLSADVEIVGLKNLASVGANVGFEVNNYLGPAINLGVKGGLNFSLKNYVLGEKDTRDSNHSNLDVKLGVSPSANLSSRTGATFGLASSLTAGFHSKSLNTGLGLGASTNYNSRSGIKTLTISTYGNIGVTSQKKPTDQSPEKEATRKWSGLRSSTISFVKPSYVPAMRLPITNTAGSGHFQTGFAMYFGEGSAEIEVSAQNSEVASEDRVQTKPMYGYFNYEKANDDPHAVLDFTRFGDKEVTPNTPIIAPAQYTYDVFSISGEGTGGTIRAYRNDIGSVHDNYNKSKDKSWGAGVEISPPAQYGLNFNIIETPSTINEWQNQNILKSVAPFNAASGLYENVYFRNPGENSVLNPNEYNSIGGTKLVRFNLEGSGGSPILTSKLQLFNNDGSIFSKPGTGNPIDLSAHDVTERKKRTQVINFFSAKEASDIGLDRTIKNYSSLPVLCSTCLNNKKNTLMYTEIPRNNSLILAAASDKKRKANHISQINVTEADGKRYVYGIPVYNLVQKDFTFSVGADGDNDNLVNYYDNDATMNSGYLGTKSPVDGYVQITETPAYVHSFLLSGLLSSDYVDVTGDGITEDDLGNAVKFNYSQMAELYKWRSPYTKDNNKATFNNGSKSNPKDNKAMISYGERENWYLHSIESKTMIAIFTLSDRKDGKSASGENGGRNASSNAIKKLEKIDLYSKADLKAHGIGLNGAKPIKTVHFDYSYKLCKGTPDNASTIVDESGKLTLNRIYFTFNGQESNIINQNQYVFGYENLEKKRELGNSDYYIKYGKYDNPDYAYNSSDRWGNFKPKSINPATNSISMSNIDFPYAIQPDNINISCSTATCTKKDKIETINSYAGAWSLKSILLPSGGQMEVNYESNSYAYVQNKRATQMVKVDGFGTRYKNLVTNQYELSGSDNHLYEVNFLNITENNVVFISVPEACNNAKDVNDKYLHIDPATPTQIAFKLRVEMPLGEEYLTSYGVVKNYGVMSDDPKKIWIELELVDGVSPLSLTAIEYLREQLPKQAYPGYDVDGETTVNQIIDMFRGVFDGLLASLSDPVNYLRVMRKKSAQIVNLNECFVRLCIPDATVDLTQVTAKYGGGKRVKSITLRDNWKKMTDQQQHTAEYKQEYDYTTTENINGKEVKISSGVASYEPSIGGEENPFQTMYQIANKVPLGPTSYGAIEMPILDAFFQAPVVGYSKVTVKSAKKGDIKSHSGIGKQVTEFYTAKDFPIKYYNTSFDNSSRLEAHDNQTSAFFHKSAFDSKALSQGFLVELNDMHGKMKSQSSYAENDENTAISHTEYYYKNTGVKGLDEKFDFIDHFKEGQIEQGNMGVDVELMTDTREFSTKSTSYEVQAQACIIFEIALIIPFFPFIWSVNGESENTYRSVTTTKVVNYHSIADKVVVTEKGSQISTENLVYDANTGQVIVNKTKNEFNDDIYNTIYPAYWAYDGMGLAYKNIDAVYKNIDFVDGRIKTTTMDANTIKNVFSSGSEVYILNDGESPVESCVKQIETTDVPNRRLLWVFDADKNTSDGLTNNNIDPAKLYFIDDEGKPYTKKGINIKIVRSGSRNMLGTTVQSITSMASPVVGNKLDFTNNTKVVAASEIEYKEKWKTDNDVFRKYKFDYIPASCSYTKTENCGGEYENAINPYTKGLIGNFRNWRSKVLYTNRTETDPNPSNKTNIAQNGFISNFNPYWYTPSNSKILVNDGNSNKQWAENSQITKINARGQELETKNALDIYTAAQYSYNKNFPTAIANNSTLSDMYYSGFEDGDFKESLNNVKENKCALAYNFFNSIDGDINTNAQIVTDLNAHTGRKVLKINNVPNGSTTLVASHNFNINKPNEDISLNMEKEYIGPMFKEGFDFFPLYNCTINNKTFKNISVDEYTNKIINGISTTVTIPHCYKVDFGGQSDCKINPDFPNYAKNKIGPKLVYIPQGQSFEYEKFWGLPMNAITSPYGYNCSNGGLGSLNNTLYLFYPPAYLPSSWEPNATFSGNCYNPNGSTNNLTPSSIAMPLNYTGYCSFNSSVFGFNGRMWSQNILNSTNNGNSIAANQGYYPYSLGNHSINPGLTRQYFDITKKDRYTFSLRHFNGNITDDWFSTLGFINTPNYAQLCLYDKDDKVIFCIDEPTLITKSIPNDDGTVSLIYSTLECSETVTLCKGRYRIEMLSYQNDNSYNSTTPSYSGVTYHCSDESIKGYKTNDIDPQCERTRAINTSTDFFNPTFTPTAGKSMLISAWVRQSNIQTDANGKPVYDKSSIVLDFGTGTTNVNFKPTGNIIDGWQRIEGAFTIPANATTLDISLKNDDTSPNFWDDIRIHPYNANMKSYVYDPINLRLTAELDENNYAKFYEYDEEGTLIRTKAETKEGIKTITETRSAKQRVINSIVE